MFKFTVYLISVLVLFGYNQVKASGDSGIIKIDRIVIMPNGTIRLYPKEGYLFNNPDSCPQTGLIILNGGNSRFDEFPDSLDRIYSTMMTAWATEAGISFWLSGCTVGPGNSSVPDIYAATIHSE